LNIEVNNLSFSYGERAVLKDICFSAECGQVLSVLGPNGVGKSTLFRCMLGLLTPQSGQVFVDGKAVDQMEPGQLAGYLAYIPQSHNPEFNYTVLDMVLMGMTGRLGIFRTPGMKEKKQAEEALEWLGIGHLKNRGYANISGGERQLVLIARAIAQQAKLLIMDEPSANLDYGNRIRVMQTVRSLVQAGYGVIQSTHDPDQAFLYSDKVLALYNGQVLAWGTPKETICDSLISRLYGVDVEVCSLRDDRLRICVPREY